MIMTICDWCGCEIHEHEAGVDGNHRDFTACVRALKLKVRNLTQELIDERVYTAALTERLEACETCPVADYEEQQKALRSLG